MHTSTDSNVKAAPRHVYVSLLVIDGERELKPAAVSFDHLEFRTPPQLLSSQIEIVLTNGDRQHRDMAQVLPHDPQATTIPIKLLKML